MTRREYLDKLSNLLSDLDSAERQDALNYYEDYFDEAGLGEEDQVMESVDSPEKVAKNIFAGIDNESEDQGVFTETGYSTYEEDSKNELVKRRDLRDKKGFLIIALILVIFALPVLGPIFGSIWGILFGLIGAAFGVIFGVFILGIALVIGGLAGAISIIVTMMGQPFGMILGLGAMLILIAVGILLTVLGVWIVSKLLPLVLGWLGDLFHKLVDRKKVNGDE